MAIRTGHGKGAGVPRVEVMPADELPAGFPAPQSASPFAPQAAVLSATQGEPSGKRRHGTGRPFDRERAREMGRLGALAKAERDRNRVQLLEGLGLHTVNPELPALHPYLIQAEEFAAHECARLAATVGGGVCGSAPASLIQTAALQLASSRYLYAQGLDLKLASTLGNDSRQNLLAAHELCAREAVARAKQPGAVDQLDAARERIMRIGAGAK